MATLAVEKSSRPLQKPNTASFIETSSGSEDDIPLAHLQKRLKSRPRNYFQQILSTPDLKQAVTAGPPRKKTINYRAQTVTRILLQPNSDVPSSSRSIPEQNISSKTKDWYCPACKENRLTDMRQCVKCKVWYHEECVGLTESDLLFQCPECFVSYIQCVSLFTGTPK
ncbi:zinc finger fyve/phd-type [Holotrichia oblita]|uniref:Zinc finger fyve/phd-type n=1 Tax=Holotrichia oblita TaxID=644536 RepID=A0ACB9TC48_HOLOL|nr:zinc finger fyve/phd-type [Holotrichia oblita]